VVEKVVLVVATSLLIGNRGAGAAGGGIEEDEEAEHSRPSRSQHQTFLRICQSPAAAEGSSDALPAASEEQSKKGEEAEVVVQVPVITPRRGG
jgi:hypothetical protein